MAHPPGDREQMMAQRGLKGPTPRPSSDGGEQHREATKAWADLEDNTQHSNRASQLGVPEASENDKRGTGQVCAC